MDPVSNPYAPGAARRPPELAGRGRELRQFDVVLERVAKGRPERSMVLAGLRGVGKTVLLNAMRSQAIARLWGTGTIEARPEQPLRRPIASALHKALRELAPRHRDQDRVDDALAVLKAFALRADEDRTARPAAKTALPRWQPGIDVPAARGRADSGDIEIDLTELLADAASVATDLGVGIALFVDECRTSDLRTSQPSVPRVMSFLRPAPRSSWSAPNFRICRPPCPRRSRTRSDCSATPASTGSTGTPRISR